MQYVPVENDRFSTIKLERRGRLLRIVLNRPEMMNAANRAMHDELVEALWFAQGDKESDVVVMTGEGRAFSAGGDVNHMELCAADPTLFDYDVRKNGWFHTARHRQAGGMRHERTCYRARL